MEVRAKKALGQHFLTNLDIAQQIAAAITPQGTVLEVGPGTGVLTQFLLAYPQLDYYGIEIDRESVAYLLTHFGDKLFLNRNLFHGDFLKIQEFPASFRVIGNFPYNISSQIFFKIIDLRDQVPEIVGMVQKEVAERLCASAGSKTYGILSVLLQSWYHMEYLFTVGPGAFVPPPKVHSAVIRLTRNTRTSLGESCPAQFFTKIVKTTFNQRRKTIRNSLKPLLADRELDTGHPLFSMRPEQLNVEQFIELTQRCLPLFDETKI